MLQPAEDLTVTGWSDDVSSAHHHVNDVTLHDVELGTKSAPLVILLHGFGDFWWGWRRQVGHLASAGFRVIAPDQRGYNLSGKPVGFKAYDIDALAADIMGLADAHGCSRFHLIGHDFGGMIAWWIATHYPERVERLVAINSFHPQVLVPYMRKHKTQLLRSAYMFFFQLPSVPEWLLRFRKFAVMRSLIRFSSRPGTFSDTDMAHYVKTWSMPGALTGMINWYRALMRKPGIENARVKPPALVIWGLADQFLEKGLADASLALCDAGEALWIENGTHWVHLEEVDLINRALVDFLKQPNLSSPSPVSAA